MHGTIDKCKSFQLRSRQYIVQNLRLLWTKAIISHRHAEGLEGSTQDQVLEGSVGVLGDIE